MSQYKLYFISSTEGIKMKRYFVSALLMIFVLLYVSLATAKEIILKTEIANPVLAAGKKQTTYIKVSLTGFIVEQKADRTPANIAIVLDKSGSMKGEKISRAKEAAILAVNLLNKNDIVSIISYDSEVQVLVPAMNVKNKVKIRTAIESMDANGQTALYDGVQKGASEIRKFITKQRVNRVILLSDGQANVGPDSPTELGKLGAALGKEGISVTTIGLGVRYNEDLMADLAGYSDGNHAFVKNTEDLAKIFQNEFGDVLSVVAQDVLIEIHLKNGVKPIRFLGREGEISNEKVTSRLNQIYSKQEKYLLLEVEVPTGKAKEVRDIAEINIVYQNMKSKQQNKLSDDLKVSFSDSEKVIKEAVNTVVAASATKQIANETSKQALKLRDQGKRSEAQKLLKDNAAYLRSKALLLGGSAEKELNQYSYEVDKNATSIADDKRWNVQRKSMKASQYKLKKQQAY
jgi:Ca-activated chloride channel homolog